jgi:hypothetical protein
VPGYMLLKPFQFSSAAVTCNVDTFNVVILSTKAVRQLNLHVSAADSETILAAGSSWFVNYGCNATTDFGEFTDSLNQWRNAERLRLRRAKKLVPNLQHILSQHHVLEEWSHSPSIPNLGNAWTGSI